MPVGEPRVRLSSLSRHGPAQSRGQRLGALLTQCAASEVTAMGVLYDETIGWVYPLACRAAEDTSGAQELTQAFYLHLWADSRQFRQDTDSAVTWVLQRLGEHLRSGADGRA
ncbi:hypothetical protein GCM10011492_12930 [Flexivirga endophytica]|uniref:RNA polymerase sigma-70 region 2 domain-containing protein n=2 Tax=Flexivirga endophytica TaxID=1849103 RepID=A0A916WRR5_9MICO|nr:hypothetical protein GCM10011492_12930 [Flexivirga endophytica]GHB63087.1 hypothetical protein GCM10008112_35050 [Flexivirga endophytica]